MDVQELVQQKLSGEEICVNCLKVDTLADDSSISGSRYIALVKHGMESSIFFYMVGNEDLHYGSDLELENVFPIDENLSIKDGGSSIDNRVSFRFLYNDKMYRFLMPGDNSCTNFMDSIHEGKRASLDNAGSLILANFGWLEKYKPSSPTHYDHSWENLFLKQPSSDLGENCPVVNSEDGGASQFFLPPAHHQRNSSDGGWRPLDLTRELSRDDPDYEKKKNRKEILHMYMMTNEAEFTKHLQFKVFCGTYNVNGREPSGSLRDWLCCDEEPPDIYCIGFQELDLQISAYVMSSKNEGEWQRIVERDVHPKAKYELLRLERLVGMMIMVLIKKEHKDEVVDVVSASVGTGFLNNVGNKGGVGVSIQLNESVICFVCSHLAAHQENWERRNQDFSDICNRMIFRNRDISKTILSHDAIFWVGDLNYRINSTYDAVVKAAKMNQTQHLWSSDQLIQQMSENNVFSEFLEGKLLFGPTYKFDPGTNTFDTSEKARVPAWTDRILWKGNTIKQLKYRSHPSLMISDHKPVSSVFDLQVKVIDATLRKKFTEQAERELDKRENDFLPQCDVNVREFTFTDLKFHEPQSRDLILKNTGKLTLKYSFINKPNDDSYCKPWLKITPSHAAVKHGESIRILIEAYVDKDSSHLFMSGADKVDDILVLHLDGGKDLFMTISGNYIPSSFGMSVASLVKCFDPILCMPSTQLFEMEKEASKNVEVRFEADNSNASIDIPKEIWRLVDHIHKYGRTEEDIFQQQGLPQELYQIRDCLDLGEPEALPGSVHSVSNMLLIFLDALPEPVIPFIHYDPLMKVYDDFSLCQMRLRFLPPSHRKLFTYICSFLRELLKYQSKNNLTLKILADMFGPIILKRQPRKDQEITHEMVLIENSMKSMFMKPFLTYAYNPDFENN